MEFPGRPGARAGSRLASRNRFDSVPPRPRAGQARARPCPETYLQSVWQMKWHIFRPVPRPLRPQKFSKAFHPRGRPRAIRTRHGCIPQQAIRFPRAAWWVGAEMSWAGGRFSWSAGIRVQRQDLRRTRPLAQCHPREKRSQHAHSDNPISEDCHHWTMQQGGLCPARMYARA